MNKILCSGIDLLLLARAVLIVIKASGPADERLTKDFIAALYSVPDHGRMQNFINKVSGEKPDWPVTAENTVQSLSVEPF